MKALEQANNKVDKIRKIEELSVSNITSRVEPETNTTPDIAIPSIPSMKLYALITQTKNNSVINIAIKDGIQSTLMSGPPLNQNSNQELRRNWPISFFLALNSNISSKKPKAIAIVPPTTNTKNKSSGNLFNFQSSITETIKTDEKTIPPPLGIGVLCKVREFKPARILYFNASFL
jgi:hypothetical protein